MASKYGQKQETRDPEIDGMVRPTPEKRHNAAILKHRKMVDTLSSALPIAESNEEMDSNYMPVRLTNGSEHMSPKYTSSHLSVNDLPNGCYTKPYSNIPQQNAVYGNKKPIRSKAVTRDMVLYIFTGVFFLFTLDSFVTLGASLH
jgi:hypothetical protein